MSGLSVHFEVLNQLGTPMLYSSTLANRPAAGIVGRIFYRTDSPYGIYRDNGISWDQIADQSSGFITGSGTSTQVAFWNGSSSISGNSNLYWDNVNSRLGIGTSTPATSLDVTGMAQVTDTKTYSTGSIQPLAVYGNITIPNGATITSGAAISSFLNAGTSTIQGSVTVPNTTVFSSLVNLKALTFSSVGTLTMTQATGVRAASQSAILPQFGGTASGTITHYAANAIYGYFNINTGSVTPTITNAYQLLINDIGDYGHTFNFTNRWGIYQNGSSDLNYFAANTLIGSNVNTGEKLQVTGTAKITGLSTFSSGIGTNGYAASASYAALFNGNVGIGTATPGQNLSVYSDTNGDARISLTNINAGTSARCFLYAITTGNIYTALIAYGSGATGTTAGISNASLCILEAGADSSAFILKSSGSLSPLVFATASLEKMRLTSGGNLLINSTTDPGQKMYLNGSLRIDGQRSATSSGSSGQHLIINCDGTTYKIALLNP